MENLKILVFNHGDFGKGIMDAAEMINGNTNDVYVFSLYPGVSLEEYFKDADEKIAEIDGPKLGVCDLYGGTPNHVAMMLSAKYDFSMICGMNLGMMLTLLTMKESADDVDQLLEEIREAGIESIQIVPKLTFTE